MQRYWVCVQGSWGDIKVKKDFPSKFERLTVGLALFRNNRRVLAKPSEWQRSKGPCILEFLAVSLTAGDDLVLAVSEITH